MIFYEQASQCDNYTCDCVVPLITIKPWGSGGGGVSLSSEEKNAPFPLFHASIPGVWIVLLIEIVDFSMAFSPRVLKCSLLTNITASIHVKPIERVML